MSDARGVHVIWMLAPFLAFQEISSWTWAKPRVKQDDETITFVIPELMWMQEISFNFTVTFNKWKSLKPTRHHVTTPVQFHYYKQYNEDANGKVLSKGALFSQPLTTIAFVVEVPGCREPLGMKSKKIATFQITASSSYSDKQPDQARESHDAWCASNTNDQQFVQVDFTRETRVTRIVTYGRRSKLFWVTQYSLQYSNDETIWTDYGENGFTKKFQGNSDQFTLKSHWLQKPIEAVSIRIRPLKWERLICMRFEIYGCEISGSPLNCIVPLGLESGFIPDEALTQSTDTSTQISRSGDIRLNKIVRDFPNGWQSVMGALDHLQIDFGSLRRVTRIATQGGWKSPFYVSGFKLGYSNNSLDWEAYEEITGIEKELKGPKDMYEAKYPVLVKLAKPFVSRFIRLIPTTTAAPLKVMRAELYGCMAEPLPPHQGLPEYSRRSFLLDPSSDLLFICMYTSNRYESSCLSTKDGKDWMGIDEHIVSVLAANKNKSELYGLDNAMNFHRSTDNGDSWIAIAARHFWNEHRKTALIMASSIPENLVSSSPSTALSAVSSNGIKWGASGSGIHMMTAGSSNWTTVGSWRCCGE